MICKQNRNVENQMWCSTRFCFRTAIIPLYVNNLSKALKLLNSTMFAGDTNLFYSHIVNTELVYLNECFNKLSLNTDAIKYTFFHKSSSKIKH